VQVLARAIRLEVPQVELATEGDSNVVTSYGVVTTGKYNAASGVKDVLEIATGGEQGFMSSFAHEASKHRCYERELNGLASRVAF
jgi:catalase